MQEKYKVSTYFNMKVAVAKRIYLYKHLKRRRDCQGIRSD